MNDAAQVQAAWDTAVAAVLADWPKTAAPLVDDLVAQVASAETVGDLADLEPSPTATAALEAAVLAAMLGLASNAAAQVVAEAAAAGVTVDPVDFGDTVKAASGRLSRIVSAARKRLADVASATATLIAGGYTAAAVRRGMHVGGRVAAEAVRATLVEFGVSVRGLVGDAVRAAMSAAQGAGRVAVYETHPPMVFVANETLDDNSCEVCRQTAGRTWTKLSDALAVYPGGQAHISCLGGARCRGYLDARWTDSEVTMAASSAEPARLTRIPNVELVRTGRWPLSSGTWDASTEDLVAAVAALNCPSIRRPVLKLGHVDPRFDGEPAIGYVDNLRITDGGHTLVGDYAGVPSWLGTIAASAYPDRSVEGTYSFRCQQGHTHPFVLTAVALLGVTPPGVGSLKSLQDVAALYGVDRELVAASGVKVVAKVGSVQAADGDRNRLKRYWTKDPEGLAKWANKPHPWTSLYRHLKKHMPDEMARRVASEWFHEVKGYWPGDRRNRDKVAASDNGGSMPSPEPSRADLIRTAYNSSGAPESRWIVEIDEEAVVVIDDTDRSLHRIPVQVGDAGVVFGSPTPVRMAYVSTEEPVAASRTVFASREESRPSATVLDTPGPPDTPDWRPPAEPAPTPPPPTEEEPQTPPGTGGVFVPPPSSDAESDEQVHTDPKEGGVSTLSTDVRSRLGLPEDADDAAVLAALDGLKQQAQTSTEPNPEQVAAAAAQAKANDDLQAEVKVMASQLAQVTAELAATKAEKAATVKASVLDDAQKQGKFAPAAREQWSKDYDDAPAAVTRILASIAPGTAVPVAAAGYTGTGDEPVESFDDAEYVRLFGEKAGA